MRMYKYLLFLLILLQPNLILAQQIDWAQERKINPLERSTKIIGTNPNGIYIIRKHQKRPHKRVYIDLYHERLRLLSTKEIVADRRSYFQSAVITEEHLVLFFTYSNRKSNTTIVKAKLLDRNLNIISEKDSLLVFNFPQQRNMLHAISGKEGIAVFHNPQQSEKRLPVVFLNNQLETIRTANISVPIDNDFAISQTLMFNHNLYLLVSEFSGIDEKASAPNSVHLIEVSSQLPKQNTYELSTDSFNTLYARMAINHIDSSIAIAGLNLQADANKNPFELTKVIHKPGNQITIESRTMPDDLKLKLSEPDGNSRLDIKSLILRNDGEMIMLTENIRVSNAALLNPEQGAATSTYVRHYYYYEDVIVFTIPPDTSKTQVKVIKKEQATMNDGATYSSFLPVILHDRIAVVFNDMSRRNRNLVNYNIGVSGEIKHETLINGKEYEVRLSVKDASQITANQILIPSYGGKKGYQLLKITF